MEIKMFLDGTKYIQFNNNIKVFFNNSEFGKKLYQKRKKHNLPIRISYGVQYEQR